MPSRRNEVVFPALEREIVVEAVDEVNAGHLEGRACLVAECEQAPIERRRPEEKGRMQHDRTRRIGTAGHRALDDAGFDQVQQSLDQHLAVAIQAQVEALELNRQRGAQSLLLFSNQLPGQASENRVLQLPQKCAVWLISFNENRTLRPHAHQIPPLPDGHIAQYPQLVLWLLAALAAKTN